MYDVNLFDTIRDLMSDAWTTIATRPSRAALSVAAFGIGIGGLVSSVGISRTAAQQIADELTPADLDVVRATPASVDHGTAGLPAGAEARAAALDGVRAVGRRFAPGADVRATRFSATTRSTNGVGVPVIVATPGLLDVAGATVQPGGAPTWFGRHPPNRTALLGTDAARELGVMSAEPGLAVWIGGRRFAVVGIISGADRGPALLAAAIIGRDDGLDVLSLHPSAEQLVVRTEPGRARPVADVLDLALLPGLPEQIRVDAPPDLANVRRGVVTELDRLALASAVLVLVLSGVAISNTMAMGVLARRGEIGLRRALGASRRSIAILVLAESTLLGVVGGLVGIVIANCGVLAIAWRQGWTPVFVAWLAPASLFAGVLVGIVAGSYPAVSAARIDAAVALKGS